MTPLPRLTEEELNEDVRRGFVDGLERAFRSLGAGTPEAQAALREYVRAGLEAHRRNEAYLRACEVDVGQEDATGPSIAADNVHERALAAWAALATGRDANADR